MRPTEVADDRLRRDQPILDRCRLVEYFEETSPPTSSLGRKDADEERKERENLRSLREQFNLEEPPPRVPLLHIEIIRDERFSEVQKRCDDYIAEGVAQVWLLDPDLKRAYTVTKAEGLREFRGGILQIANPPLEVDLSRIFD